MLWEKGGEVQRPVIGVLMYCVVGRDLCKSSRASHDVLGDLNRISIGALPPANRLDPTRHPGPPTTPRPSRPPRTASKGQPEQERLDYFGHIHGLLNG